MIRARFVSAAFSALVALTSCGEPNCLEADQGCTVPTPCDEIELACSDPAAPRARTLAEGDPIPGGLDALASPGDVALSNGVVTAVIDALDHPHYVAPTGGNLLDLVSASGDDDSLTHVFHAVGLLPGDSVAYGSMTIEEDEDFAAVQVHGTLAGFSDVRVTTRYEIRPCEPGIRVRTEIVNRSAEPRVWSFVDAWYWSGREAHPFAPGPGRGFDQPGIVSPVADSWEPAPFMAAAAHADPAATYFEVACNEEAVQGFHSEQISAAGLAPRVISPRGYEIFERFIGVVPGRAIGPAADVALELRRQLFDEQYAELRGVLRAADVRSVRVDRDDVDVGAIDVAASARLELTVRVDGAPDHAQVFLRPADDATEEAVRASLFGFYVDCAPLLGSPTGGSPACDRVMVEGTTSVEVPPGRYDVFATAGIFATVARETVELSEGDEARVELAVERLDVAPAGTLGADFHVHGAASFDSTVPDFDRVQAFLAANVDVIAATDHDVVWDYADARAALDADERIEVIVGLEATGHILFDLTPGNAIPQVIGHWNVWPLPFSPTGPYRGAPWDELAEPGTLFTRFVEAGWPSDTGVIQLNHPWAAAQFGRDLGFPRAVGVDAREPLPREFDGTGPSLVMRTPEGASFSNADYHTQEVMNGTANEDLLPYRAYWFYLLNQGIVRAGTANSDSHGLVDNVLGTPRTLVWTEQTVGDAFDVAAFDADVRAGRMIGTNGPVIELATTDASGAARGPSVEPFEVASDATLSIRVSAAPWVPIDEIRVVVNGLVARTFVAELTHPPDPLGTDGILRFEGEIALSEVLPPDGRDAWIVVEAGAPLAMAGDLDCNGIPDTGDNDGDGDVDWRDVDRNDDDVVDERDAAELGGVAPVACDPDQDVGPLGHPPLPARGEPGYVFLAVTPEGYPAAFTNPLLIDRDGGGFDGPGLGGAP